MADRILLVTWREAARGLEQQALEAFNDALGMMGRKQQEGKIDSFDVALMAPSQELGGLVMVRGSAEQIDALRNDEEFLRNTMAAQLCVDGISHIEGWTNEGVASMMAMYQEALQKLPQHT